jgi:hypothetical protein
MSLFKFCMPLQKPQTRYYTLTWAAPELQETRITQPILDPSHEHVGASSVFAAECCLFHFRLFHSLLHSGADTRLE